MRYDDASQAGSMAHDSSPVANPDVDALAPGSFGPASGNVITGAGTTTGASGADNVGDAPGLIIALQGAGGPAANAAGSFQANGQYGVLSMDAQGNFNYVRNAGTPDGVQDVFNYTLADRDGQTSSTTLSFDIAKGGVGQAAVVPGTAPLIPGIVNLPAGVQMSDIHVVGRDLVINMPDGTQMVIPNGAVFVPQLVIGDVQLPASNLAALLVESEPQPAAGPLQSSGGNFATDVPPLDPGVPLGDLIPPTELVFTLPDFEEIGDLLDQEPDAGAASLQLDDDDVPNKGGNPGGTGDDAGSPNATGSGFLPGSGGDGALTWDLLNSGAPSGFSYVDGPNGSILIQQVQNGSTVTVLTVTINPSTGAFTATENNPILHATGDNENNAIFVINYTVTDEDGDSAPGTLTINVDDDTPVVTVNAGPDANVILTTDDSQTIGAASDTASTSINFSGVFTGTTVSPGADGAGPGTSSTYALAVTGQNSGLTSHGAVINLFMVGGVVVGTTAGTAPANLSDPAIVFTVSTTNTGIVTLTQFQQIDHPAGQDPTPTGTPFIDQIISMADGLVTLTRSETVVDKDGDQVTGSASVNIGANLHFTDDGPTIGLADHGEPTLVVDETNLAANDTESFAANFTANFGADGPAAAGGGITYALGINAGATGLIDTLSGQAVVLSVVNGQVVGTAGAGGPTVFVVSVDASGNVTLDQQRAVMHTPDSGPDQTTTLAADNLVTLTATATDFDGDTASQLLPIGFNLIFHDDAPSATQNQVTGTVDEDGVPAGIPGGPGDVAGEATVATGSVTTLFNSGADQPLSFSLLADTSGLPVLTSAGVAVTYSVVGNTLTASAGANTVFTFVLNSNGNFTFTLVDQIDHLSLNGQAGDNTENDLQIALGSIIQATDHDGDSVAANANGLVITVDDDTPTNNANVVTLIIDEDGLAGGNAGGPGDGPGTTVDAGSISGLFNSGADQPLTLSMLTDTSGLPVLMSNGVAVTYAVVGNTLTASAGANTVFTVVLNPATGNVTFTLVDQLDHPTLNGVAGDNTENNLILDFSSLFAGTDADGDSVTLDAGSLLVDVDDDTPANNANVVTLIIDEDGLAGGNAGGPGDGPGTTIDAGSIASLFSAGADAPVTLSMLTNTSLLPALMSNGVAVTYAVVGNTLTASAGANTVFTLVLNPATGNVTFTLVDQLDHPTLNGLAGDNTENNLVLDFSSLFQATDADGDSVTLDAGSFLVDVDDDTPVATAAQVTGTVDEDGVPGGIAGGPGDVAGTATQATGSVSTLFSAGADAPLSFGLTANFGTLPALTSGGAQVTYGVSGNTLTASAGGNTVFTFVLNANGTWTFTLSDQIDHPTLNGLAGDDTENDLLIDLSSAIQATDADGDTVGAAANGLVITVDDDTPVAVNDTDTVGAPGSTATGNVITDAAPGDSGDTDNGADSVGADQPGSIIALASVNNAGATDTDAGPNFSIQGQYGTLVMDTNGNYTYTRAAGTPGGATDTFTYTLQDFDGDKTTATLTITLADNVPTAGTVNALLDDDALGGIAGGPDDDSPDTLNLTGTLPGSGGDGTLTFGILTSGAPSGFSYVSGGAGVVLVQQVQNGSTVTVITVTVNSTTGAYTIVQNHAIDHPTLNGLAGDNTENNVSFAITYTVTDQDGDPASPAGTININVDDDSPTVSANAAVQLDDETLAGGIAGGVGDVNPNTANLTGTLGHNYGADGAGSMAFLTTNAPAGFTYELSGSNLLIKQGSTTVITVTLNTTTGAYTVTQNAPILHPAGGDENDVQFNIGYTVTDHDGDTVQGGLTINVDDDSPNAAIVESGSSVSIDESVGIQADSDDTTDPAVIALFAGVSNKGVDTDLPQYAKEATSIVTSTGSGVGADTPGTTVFSLTTSNPAGGVDSNLDTTDGTNIFLFVENGLVVGRVGATALAAASGPAAFAIAIDQSGHISMVEYLSIHHPDATNPDDTQSILDSALKAVVTVTDADGDSATASTDIGARIVFQDSGPVMTGASNINIQNTGDVAASGTFSFNLGADNGPTNNDVIKTVVGSATVAGNPVQNFTLTPGTETATTATYTFSFDYDTGNGGLAHETGTLTFNKAAGTYTIDLDNPIQAFSTLQTAEGTAFVGYEFNTTTEDHTSPVIAVTTILDESAPGAHDGFFVQFTGFGAGNATHETIGDGTANTFVNGDLFSEGTGADALHSPGDWVSVSNSSNGVGGDTINGPDAINFNLYNSNPTGTFTNPTGNLPTASASDMFLRFDGVAAGDDMIVVLKLWSDTNGIPGIQANDTFTTRAIVVEAGDIYLFGGSGAGSEEANTLAALAGSPFEDIAAGIIAEGGSNNNDGLVIIESNDYNAPGETWQIVGAEIINAALGVSGTGFNLDPDVGSGGGSTGTSQSFAVVDDGAPMKITNIGFIAGSTVDQTAHLTFDVTIQDGDGDTVTQTINADVTAAADSSTPISLSGSVTTISQTPLSTKSTVSTMPEVQTTTTNSNAVLMGAFAAAGLAASEPLAAHDFSAGSHVAPYSSVAGFHAEALSSVSLDALSGSHGLNLTSLAGNGHATAQTPSASFQGGQKGAPSSALDAGGSHSDAQAPTALSQGTDAPAHGVAAAALTAGGITMPDAAALLAAHGVAGQAASVGAQHNAVVGQVLADALHGGGNGPNVEALINAIANGGEPGHGAAAALASHAGGGVPNGHMEALAAFAAHQPMHMMEVLAAHADAVPAQA